jgi:hypothetical protein
MCNPVAVAVAGTALTTAGTMYNNRQAAQNQARGINAANAATVAEMGRQQGFQREADESFARTLGMTNSQATAQQRQRGEQNRNELAARIAPSVDFTEALPNSTPQVIRSNVAASSAGTAAESEARARALAALQSHGDGTFGQMLNIGRGANQMRDINATSTGSASLLGLDRQAAARNAQKAPSMFGDVLGMAGQGLSLAGFTGYNPFGSGNPPGGPSALRTGRSGGVSGMG